MIIEAEEYGRLPDEYSQDEETPKEPPKSLWDLYSELKQEKTDGLFVPPAVLGPHSSDCGAPVNNDDTSPKHLSRHASSLAVPCNHSDGTAIQCTSLKSNMGHLEAAAAAAGLSSLIVGPLLAGTVAVNAQLRGYVFTLCFL